MSDFHIRDKLAARYCSLDVQAQQHFLVNVANLLTLVGRDTYGPDDDVLDSARLRAVNEAMHRILGKLHRLMTADEHRYPDEVFANIVIDQCKALNVNPERLISLLE